MGKLTSCTLVLSLLENTRARSLFVQFITLWMNFVLWREPFHTLSSPLLSLKEPQVEAALKQMIDRCQSGSQESTVSATELGSILGVTDGETALTICSLFSKVQLHSYVLKLTVQVVMTCIYSQHVARMQIKTVNGNKILNFLLKRVSSAWEDLRLKMSIKPSAFPHQDESVDLRQVCLSVAAVSGFFSFKSLLHTGFNVSPAPPPVCQLCPCRF